MDSLKTDTTPIAGNSQVRRPAKRRRWMIATLVVLILIGAALAWAFRTPPIQALLPADTVAMGSADIPWWWHATASLRQRPSVQKEIAQAERESSISFEKDIIPWAGQMDVAELSADDAHPQYVVCVQVRDWFAFGKCLAHLRSVAAQKSSGTWSKGSYQGVTRQRLAQPHASRSDLPIEFGMIKRWIVIGIGNGALEKVIDVWHGRQPSLQTNSAWSTALAQLPRTSVLWGGCDSSVYDKTPKGRPIASMDQAFSQSVSVGALSDLGNGLQFDAVSSPKTAQGRTFWHDLKGTAGPVTDKTLAQMPNDASIALLVDDPSQWWGRADAMIEKDMTASERTDWEHSVDSLGPASKVLGDFTGGSGVALLWNPIRGFGAVAVAQSDNPATLAQASTGTADLLRRHGEAMQLDGSIWRPNHAYAHYKTWNTTFAPCWKTTGNELTVGTASDWLDAPTGRPTLRIPAEARQAEIVALGNFRAAPSLLDRWATQSGSHEFQSVVTAIRKADPPRVEWAAWLALDQSGRWQHATFQIKGWDWRQTLDNSVKSIP